MDNVANRIKHLRKEKLHMNQTEFADKISLNGNSITRIETGTRNPSERTLKMISDVYNVNIEWLKNGNEPIFNELSREEEIVSYIGNLVSNDDSDMEFQKKFIKVLAKLDIEEWKMIEKIVNNLVKEKD